MFAAATCFAAPAGAKPASLAPATMPKAGTIDERFQSYNIEMVEVTGGRFWKPYDSRKVEKVEGGNQPAIVDPSLFEYRSPINLSNARLRKLAAALGPAYVRVSGTWANATYFQNSDDPAPVTPPKGYNGVLTRAQWKGVIDFSKAVNANLVTSFATSMGTRDADGVWTPDEARQWVDYTKSIGGSIAAAEYMNEPNMPEGAATPKGYDAAAYGRDVKIFHAFAKEALPGMVFLGTGAAGEGTLIVPGAMHMLSSADMLTATGPVFDAISYHSYGGVSSRCASFGPKIGTTAEAALSEDWLARSEQTEEFYRALRDRFEPGKPMWNTETAQTACGGDRWASTFLDTQSAWHSGQARRAGAPAQHPCRQRLRAARSENVRASPQLLGRAGVAQADGNHRARCRHVAIGQPQGLCTLPAQSTRRRGHPGHQHQQGSGAVRRGPRGLRALHAQRQGTGEQAG
jgi:hypothetical protein